MGIYATIGNNELKASGPLAVVMAEYFGDNCLDEGPIEIDKQDVNHLMCGLVSKYKLDDTSEFKFFWEEDDTVELLAESARRKYNLLAKWISSAKAGDSLLFA